jgi:hypothetical protein
MLLIVPPLFRDSVYFDNVYNTILYLIFSYIGIVIPFVFDKIKGYTKILSTMIGAWCFAGLVFELLNFKTPEVVFNSKDNDFFYLKYLIAFTVGISFIITSQTWSKQKK